MKVSQRGWLKLARLAMYLLYAAAGLLQVFAPSEAVARSAGALTEVWAGMLCLGGLVAALGTLLDRWSWEAAAQALIGAAALVWGVALVGAATPARWSYVCLLLAVMLGSLLRAAHLLRLASAARRGRSRS